MPRRGSPDERPGADRVGAGRGVGGSTYYTPAYISLVAASVGLISVPTQLAGYRERGVLRRMRASGLPVSAVLGAQLAVGLGLATVGAAVVTAFSFLTNEPEPPEDPVGVVVAFLVGTVALILLGILLGAVLPTARAAQGAGVLLWFVLLILGGAGPPPEVLPDAMGTVGALTPLRPLVLALQDPWFSGAWNAAMLAVLVGIGAVSWALASWRLRRD
jgi:ABC-2 type transport system permease protein